MITITATINGKSQTLSTAGWSKITGHSAPSIAYRSKLKHLTPYQIIGLDKIDKPRVINSKRDKAICEMYKTSTLRETAKAYGITYQRVQQITSRNGLTLSDGGAGKQANKEKDKLISTIKSNGLKTLKTYGCTRNEVNKIRNTNPDYIKDYKIQRKNAIDRGIGWSLTLIEWIELWELSGKYELRGRRLGEYVMGRFGDTGPYSLNNVEIITCTKNITDGYSNRRKKRLDTNATNL